MKPTSPVSLTAQQVAALAIARNIRANIRINCSRRHEVFHRLQCKFWNQAAAQSIPYGMVHGALQLLD